jgi:hypothetical protein
MSLILPVEPVLTPAQTAAAAIREQVQRTWRTMVLGQIDIFAKVWKSGDYTPQEVLDELGTDAAQLFQLGAANVTTILTIDPTALAEPDWKPPHEVTLNPDGTVTVVVPEPDPES